MHAPLKVSGIDHVVYHVKDLPRARKFYVELLGMEVDHEKGWQCFLKCGNQGVALFEVDDDEEVHPAAKSITWRCAWQPATKPASKRPWKTPASRFTAALTIRIAFTSTIPTDTNCNF